MSKNTCPICLCSLAVGAIGVSSCGHPFHRECWDQWVAVATSKGNRVKCPTCNVRSKDFTTVYINLAENSNDDDNDNNDGGSNSETKYYERRYYETVKKCEDVEKELDKITESNKQLLLSYENAVMTISRQKRRIERCEHERTEDITKLTERLKASDVRCTRYERDLKAAKEGNMAEFNQIKSQHTTMRNRIKSLESENRTLVEMLQDRRRHHETTSTETLRPTVSNKARVRTIMQVQEEFEKKAMTKKSSLNESTKKSSMDSMKVSSHSAAAFRAFTKQRRKADNIYDAKGREENVNIATSFLIGKPTKGKKRQASRSGALTKRWDSYDS